MRPNGDKGKLINSFLKIIIAVFTEKLPEDVTIGGAKEISYAEASAVLEHTILKIGTAIPAGFMDMWVQQYN